MPDQPLHTPAAAAKLVIQPPHGDAVNVHTLRRWCAQHAQHLSAGANPNSEGGAATRWLTDRDIEVLRTIAQLRATGLDTAAVNDKLATMSFAVVVAEDDNVETPVDHPIATPPTQPQNAQEAPHSDLLLPIVLSGVEKRQDATDKRIDALERALISMEARQGEVANKFVSGAIVGGGVVLVFVALVLALTR